MKKLISIACAATALSSAVCAFAADNNEWQFVSAGSEQTYAIKADGSLWAWGSAEYGELGNGSKTPAKVSTPTQIAADKKWKFAAGGAGRAFFIAEDGTLWSTGTAGDGLLGTNSSIAQTVPVQVGTDTNWALVVTSNGGMNYDALAIRTDGTLWGWGKNHIGCLGIGTYQSYATPQQIGTDNDWVSVSLGSDHSLVLKKDGTIWGAGNANKRALGKGNTGYCNTLVKVADAADWKEVYAIEDASYAIKSDGTLWAWGDNEKNILGFDNAEESAIDTPTQITSINGKAISISGSQFFRAVLVSEEGSTASKVYAWGQNYLGELGNGTGVERDDIAVVTYTTPQEVLFENPVELKILSSGQNFSVVLTTDGKLFGWGSNSWGQLGTSEPENKLNAFKSTPILVAAGATTSIDNILVNDNNVPQSVYKIAGEYITTVTSESEISSLPAGLYIIAGKKILIK